MEHRQVSGYDVCMQAGLHNIVVEKGATFTLDLIWKDENGDPIDITGYTARMHLRGTKDSADTIVALTSAGGDITLGDAAGTIAIAITSTVTATIEQKEGFYDLELVSGATVSRLIEGTVVFSNEVTR